MNTFQLEAFRAIARCLSYRQAAKELFVSRSLLSKIILALEEELSVVLFARQGNKIKLTKAGEMFLESADFILNEYYQVKTDLKLLKRRKEGILSLVLDQNVEYANVYEHIENFMQLTPGCQVEIFETRHSHLLDQMDKIKADVAIGHFEQENAAGYVFNTLSTGTWQLLVSKSHPLSAKDCIEWSQAKKENFIFPSDNEHFKRMVLRCQRNGFYPQIRYRCSSLRNVIYAVSCNLGVALIPTSLYLVKIPDYLKLVRLMPEVNSTLSIVYRKNENFILVRQFVDFISRSYKNGFDNQSGQYCNIATFEGE
ncbi:MAG: LysR family transcriptional regulator [bacterium]|jgi:DNA-binding transcriptional LysR family regulator